MSRIRWIRIVIGGFLTELATFAVFIPSTIAFGQVTGMYVAVGASLLMPFLFGIWTARKAEAWFVLHGLLVGFVGILIYVGLSRAQPEPLLYIFGHALKLVGGAAGGYVVRRQRDKAALGISVASTESFQRN